MKLDKIILFCFILVLFVGVVSAEEISGDAPVNLEDSKDLQSYDSNQKDVDDNAVISDVKSDDVESKNLKSNNLESNKIESNKIESTDKLRSEPEDDKSFTALNETINSGSSEINIGHDYVFNNETDEDFVDGIDIRDKTITINGNNKFIDAQNQADIFNIISSNVIIENLRLINAGQRTIVIDEFSNVTAINVTFENTAAVICSNSNCTTINVTFENTTALVCLNSNYTSSNDKFINTYKNNVVLQGYAIYAVESHITLDNIYFENEDNSLWSLIYTEKSHLSVLNSVFNNLTSKYATILYSKFGTVEVVNSTFTNLTANLTAGAIGLKSCEIVVIDNCTFINVSSVKNGGAIFADINGNTVTNGEVLIVNTLFDDCYSAFGGAYLQLGGTLHIMNSNFTDNCAGFDGGAIYTSYADVSIWNSSFVNNCADLLDNYIFHGAAILIDNGTLMVNSSNFINNKIINGAAIYLYDSEYLIGNSSFMGNDGALLTYFDKVSDIQENNNFNGEEVSLNNTFYDFNSLGVGHEIVLNTTIINASATDAYLDLRKLNLITPVKDQGDMGACWAFGSTAAIEAAFLKATGIILDISENNLQDSGLVYSIYGVPLFEGGFKRIALSYCLSWLGVLPAEDDVYDEMGKISPLIYDSNSYHVLDAIMIPGRNASDEDQTADIYMQLKEALIKYGALAVGVNGQFLGPNLYNDTYHSVYCPVQLGVNHVVCLVGWDDTFPAANFTQEAPGDGAWIIKNSWGSGWGDGGYYYLSYYDQNFLTDPEGAIGYIFDNTVRYDAVYQYDVINYVDYNSNASVYRDVFVAEDYGLLSAVGTYFNESNVDYTVNIYVDDDIVYSQSGKSLWPGYHTIKLDKAIPLTEGVIFAVEIESNSVPMLFAGFSREHFLDGVSFIRMGSELVDISAQGSVASVKAYVLNATIVTNDLVKDFGDNNQFTADVTDPDVEVVFEINGENYTVTSDKNGIATLEMNFNPGTYTVTTYYDGLSIINKVTINDSPAYKWVTQQNQTISELEEKVNTTETELQQADNKNKELTTQKDDATKALAAKNAEATQLVADKTNLQNQVNTLNSQLTTAQNANTEASAKISKVKAASKVKKSKKFKITVTLSSTKVNGKYVYVIFNGKSYKAKVKNGVAKITIKPSALKKLGGKTVKYSVVYDQSIKNKSVKIKK